MGGWVIPVKAGAGVAWVDVELGVMWRWGTFGDSLSVAMQQSKQSCMHPAGDRGPGSVLTGEETVTSDVM